MILQMLCMLKSFPFLNYDNEQPRLEVQSREKLATENVKIPLKAIKVDCKHYKAFSWIKKIRNYKIVPGALSFQLSALLYPDQRP